MGDSEFISAIEGGGVLSIDIYGAVLKKRKNEREGRGEGRDSRRAYGCPNATPGRGYP